MKADRMNEAMSPEVEVEENESKKKEMDFLLEHMSQSSKSFAVRDRTGLRISFAGILPLTTGENGEQRIWAGSIILNSGELEYPKVDYKLRVTVKKRFNPKLTCNRSKGTIKQDDIFVLTYQLPESSIEAVQLTLIVDGSPHEVALCKPPKADYFWLGKDTNVPGPKELLEQRKQDSTSKTEPTVKNSSPGRIDEIPEGLKEFLLKDGGFESMCKLLYPHCISLFKDLSSMAMEKFDMMEQFENQTATDVIAEAVVQRFHEGNRQKFVTTPALLQ